MRIAALVLVSVLASCSTTVAARRDWSQYRGPGAEHFQREELPFPQVEDPLEPMNRIGAGMGVALMRYVQAPAARVYRAFVPKDVRERLFCVGENLLYPVRGLNNLLQGKWLAAGEETARFAVNTTAGALGLFDPARDLGLEPHYEDFGQTLAHWGWKRSTYLFLPILGPSTVRDALGKAVDLFADPAVYRFPVAWIRSFNTLSDTSEETLRLERSSYDAYEPVRTLYVLDREIDLTNFSWKRDESAATQTLDAVFLTFEDPEFPRRARIGKVRLDPTGRELPYSLWLQPGAAPLVYIIPGLGGHRLSNATLGLAEIAYQNGNSVVALSNPTNWEFIERAATVAVPGYAPADVRDLHRALTAVDRDLAERHPNRFTERRLTGMSLGGFHTLFIAAAEEEARQAGLLTFDLYLALDVPVSLEHAMRRLDAFYNAPLAFPAEERARRIAEIFGKVLYLSQGELTPSLELPFTQVESQFLIGLAFRMDLQYVILQTQRRHDLGILQTKRSYLRRAPAFREASEYSYMEYMYAFVLPYISREKGEFSADEAGAREMFERCDLHAIAAGLRSNARVRLFANDNDFLLRAEDILWLRELLGDRARFFQAGGHLGNLHRKTIQQIIQATVEEAASRSPDTP